MTTTTRAEHGPELATTNTPGYHIRRDTCRYLVRRTYRGQPAGLDRCTAEPAEPGAEIDLCLEHLAAALQLLTRRGATVDRMTPATQADDVLADAHRQHTEDQP